MSDTTVTVRLSQDLKNRLDAIGSVTRRSKSFLAHEAIANYVETEEKMIAGILEAQAQIKQGLGVSHEDAMTRIRAYIQKTAKTEAA
jgi:predicted transcriptional regulator